LDSRYFAFEANKRFQSGDNKGGNRRAKAALYVSMSGIIVTIAIVSALVFVMADKQY